MDRQTILEGTPRGVLIRDFLIFQLKTALDGLKDATLIPLATVIVLVDLIFGSPQRRGRTFYSLMETCESFDRWLNLYGAARGAGGTRDGLFTASEPRDGTMAGDIEDFMRRGDRPGAAPERRPGLPGEGVGNRE